MVHVSIIIPSWNREKDLEICLSHVKYQTYKDFEVIVVDNNSSDGTKRMIKNNFPKFKIVSLDKNVGAARARNIGIKKAKGEYLWFLDSDAYPKRKTCLKDMIQILKKNSEIGQLGGDIIEGRIRIPHPYRNQDGYFDFVDSCSMTEVDSINTANCIMKKKLVEEIGGFDPGYFYGYEDNEMSFKVKQRGYKVIIDDKVLAVHSIARNSRVSTLYLWQRNRIRFVILKEKFIFWIFLPLIDAYLLLKLLPKKLDFLKKSNVSCFKRKRGIFEGGIIFGFSLIGAYSWAIFNLPKLLKIKKEKPNFLKNEN